MEIKDLIKLAASLGIISFSGGIPGNELFPLDMMDKIYASLTEEEKQIVMQYEPTNGLPMLLESLSEYLKKKGLPEAKNRLMITTG